MEAIINKASMANMGDMRLLEGQNSPTVITLVTMVHEVAMPAKAIAGKILIVEEVVQLGELQIVTMMIIRRKIERSLQIDLTKLISI